MSLSYALESDRGRLREGNEDSASAVPELGLFLVADGMGGHVAGEVASRVAVTAMIEAVRSQPVPKRIRDERRVMANAALAANLAVIEEADRRALHGMGTTLTALRIRSRSAIVASVGDSRAYVLTQSLGLRQLTQDQTVVALMVSAGKIKPEEALTHAERHVLTQALGTRDAIEPQVVQTTLRPGNRLLLSSDGLHDIVPPRELAALAAIPNLDDAARAMIDRANQLGGPDNITALLIDP